jgi:hypothetical protein
MHLLRNFSPQLEQKRLSQPLMVRQWGQKIVSSVARSDNINSEPQLLHSNCWLGEKSPEMDAPQLGQLSCSIFMVKSCLAEVFG